MGRIWGSEAEKGGFVGLWGGCCGRGFGVFARVGLRVVGRQRGFVDSGACGGLQVAQGGHERLLMHVTAAVMDQGIGVEREGIVRGG